MERFMNLSYSSTLSSIKTINESFDAAKLRIAYTGKNRNNSYISKEAFEDAIPTMFNCPVVAHYERDANEIGSHDMEIVEKDGDLKIVYITQPVGLVPESARWYWEEVEDASGIHQYLVTDVFLWKRQEAYEKIKENGITKQSMEITVTDGEMMDDYYQINKFIFTAFCLLGTAEPCFESAALFTFSNDEEKQNWEMQYKEMVNDFKQTFAAIDIKEGKEEVMNEKLMELLEKYNVTEADLPFEITEELSAEELEEKFAEAYPEEPVEQNEEFDDKDDEDAPAEEDDDQPADDEEDEDSGEEDFALNSQLRESLYEAISAEQYESAWGTVPRYWMVDFDAETSEVYFYDEADYKLYGATYTVDGDDIKVDFESVKRKKYAIVDYVEGSTDTGLIYEQVNSMYEERYTVALETATAEYERELEVLRQFKAEKDAEACDSIFADTEEKFEDISDSEEYQILKANYAKAEQVNPETLQQELFALVGKLSFANKVTSLPKAGIVSDAAEREAKPYGDLFD